MVRRRTLLRRMRMRRVVMRCRLLCEIRRKLLYSLRLLVYAGHRKKENGR
jgi:hypothetical protein